MTDGESRDPVVYPGQSQGLPYSACGKYDVHRAHFFPAGGLRESRCRGWTASEQSVRELILSVREYILLHWPAAGPPLYGELPPGLRLEMHPQALRAFMYITGTVHGDVLPGRYGFPVRVNAYLPVMGWRLAIVTENVLLEGKAADDPR